VVVLAFRRVRVRKFDAGCRDRGDAGEKRGAWVNRGPWSFDTRMSGKAETCLKAPFDIPTEALAILKAPIFF